MPEAKPREPDAMGTAQLLGWAERCLELAEDRTDSGDVEEHTVAARGQTAAAIDAVEEDA